MFDKNVKAQYEHDCDKCIFLGHYRKYDVYYCPRPGNKDVTIFRRSGRLLDYFSFEVLKSIQTLKGWTASLDMAQKVGVWLLNKEILKITVCKRPI